MQLTSLHSAPDADRSATRETPTLADDLQNPGTGAGSGSIFLKVKTCAQVLGGVWGVNGGEVDGGAMALEGVPDLNNDFVDESQQLSGVRKNPAVFVCNSKDAGTFDRSGQRNPML